MSKPGRHNTSTVHEIAGASLLSVLILGLVLMFGGAGREPAEAHSITGGTIGEAFLPAATVVDTDISVDTTWTELGSPYLVDTYIAVAVSATLTISPGVEVRFGPSDGLNVLGKLVASGTASKPITLTGTTKEAGWWDGLKISGDQATPNASGSVLDHVAIEYGGSSGGNLYLSYATVVVSNSTFRNSSRDGIYGWYGGLAHISDTIFTGNLGYAVNLTDGSVNPTLARLTATGNTYNGVAIGGGSMTGAHVWEASGVPYFVTGDQTLEQGGSLTVEPGVEVQFGRFDGLTVWGKLTAVGTAARPITFTGQFTTPVAGWWDGINLRGNAGSINNSGSALSYTTIEYGGAAGGNLMVSYATITVTNSTIRNSSQDGINGWYDGLAHIADTTFTGNQRYAVNFTDGSVNPTLARLTATGNTYNGVAIGGGSMTGAHVWEAAGVTYFVTGDQTLELGASLTVEPGVEVRFEQFDGLTVWGKLTAVGTATQPITFTGQFTTPASGWWDGIMIRGNSDTPNNSGSALSYATVEFGGSSDANLYVSYATVNVTNSSFRKSGKHGIGAWYDGIVNITDTILTDNTRYAVFFNDGSVNPVLARLTATGNGENAVGLGGGAMEGAHTWEATGLPYLVTADESVETGGSLTVEPGVEVRFEQYSGLTSYGKLVASGTASRPITFTGTTKQAGWWDGLSIMGNSGEPNEAGSRLENVTIEYGGNSNANLYVSYSQVSVANSIIRNSGTYGLHAWYGGSGSIIERSQIINNTSSGVQNDDDGILLASNNWWGAATGPSTGAQGCNPSGTGSTVSSNVEFRPFLTSAGSDPGPLAPADARVLSVTPQRWFVPADGVMRAWVTVTLRTGEGQPLPGRMVRLESTRGDVTDGDITNAQGQALAYVTSDTPGQAELNASLDLENSCETARSASATITFTPAQSVADLLPEEAAPYLNEGIDIDPEPITQGVPTRLSARLKNPNDFPISVNATFGIAQLGIGLAFGPVGEVQDQIIPAKSEGVVQITWTPPISGHYCVRIEYSYRAANSVSAMQTKSGSAQLNLEVRRGSTGSGGERGALNKAKKSIDAINNGKMVIDLATGPAEMIGLGIPDYLFGKILDFNFDTWGKASEALAGDPPRQDYTLIATPETLTFTPMQPSSKLPAARATAANSLMEAAMTMTSLMRAATVSLDRYAGASEAEDEVWAARQVAALTHYKKEAGPAIATVADRIDALLAELRSEGFQDVTVSASTVQAYQDRLRSTGFSAEDLQAARAVGLSDAEIESLRLERIAASPTEVAGSIMSDAAQIATDLRTLGNLLATQPSPLSISGVRGQASTNNLARIYSTDYSFQLGNPLTQTATISLTVRRVDMPADWMVAVSPITATMAAGAQTTVRVDIEPGSATTQGTQPRVAVEGYAGGQLIGGVVFDVMVPEAVAFDTKSQRAFIPLTTKSFDSAW